MHRHNATFISIAAMTLAAAVTLAIPAQAQAQDKSAAREAVCAQAPNATQRDICLDRDLTRRDAYLNEVYDELRKKLGEDDFKPVREDQRAWLKERDRCGANSKCTAEKYEDRTADIEQMIENATHPNKSHVEIGCIGPDKTYKNGVCLSKPGSADANNADMLWQTSAMNDPANKGRYTATLRFGVPETDNIAFDAICSPGGSAKFATTTIQYNPGTLREGTNVKLELTTDAGTRTFDGEIYGTQIEEGVTGVLFRPEVTDVFWQELASGTTLSYAVKGRKKATLSLKGASGPIQKFNDVCRAIAFSTDGEFKSEAAEVREEIERKPPRPDRTCSFFGFIQSRASRVPVTVTFTNKTDALRTIMWINFKGQPVTYAELDPGQSYTANTFESHPWMFTDGPGNCIEMFMTKPGATSFEISAPSPAFGPDND